MSNELWLKLKRKCWADAEAILQTEAGCKLANSTRYPNSHPHYLPLHYVLTERGPESLVMALYTAYENAATCSFQSFSQYCGSLFLSSLTKWKVEVMYGVVFPIHIALANKYSYEVISVLFLKCIEKEIEMCTSIYDCRQIQNILPLQFALRCGADFPVIKLLISKYRDAVSSSAQIKSISPPIDILPIHFAVEQAAEVSVIAALLLCFPQSLDVVGYSNISTKNMANDKLEPLSVLALKQSVSYWARFALKLNQDTLENLDDVVKEAVTDLEDSSSVRCSRKSQLGEFQLEMKLGIDAINLSLSELLREMKALNSRLDLAEAYAFKDSSSKDDGNSSGQLSQKVEVLHVRGEDEMNEFKRKMSKKMKNLEARLNALETTANGHDDY
eukprot:CAMPEP_0116010112 /NCGR_PEP_ID=MMETSP0321-20121206/3817_1 /TAXON_ID=163516 /ORGANISM="Leptocylindrus danicus var. danicus, Strain B650" /LENGTH=386 /DNA_ID=CAMNT_0003479169 /DNA_START=9 /DNA_END=1169 /DNA_ORIENTATION=-